MTLNYFTLLRFQFCATFHLDSHFPNFLVHLKPEENNPLKKYIHIQLQINKINRMHIKHNLASGDRDKEL